MSQNTQDIFSVRLVNIRKKKNETQQQLADSIGVSRSTIASYENGLSIPDIEVLAMIANHFNVSTDYLLGLQDNTTHDLDFICKEIGLSELSIKILQEYATDNNYTDDLLGLNHLIAVNKFSRPLRGLGRCVTTPVIEMEDFGGIENWDIRSKYCNDPNYVFGQADSLVSPPEATNLIQLGEHFQFQCKTAFDQALSKIFENEDLKKIAVEKLKEKYKKND